MFQKREVRLPRGISAEEQLREALDMADAVVIGAGAGLSTSAGFLYSGDRFSGYFGDFEKKYGFHDMYTGGFYPYKTLEEYWAYWSRYIQINRYMQAPKPVYEKLRHLLEGKDYFVITTNVDHCFQKAGFDRQRLFYTQGDYGLFQCSRPCHKETYDNEEIIRKMVEAQGYQILPSGEPRLPGRDPGENGCAPGDGSVLPEVRTSYDHESSFRWKLRRGQRVARSCRTLRSLSPPRSWAEGAFSGDGCGI